MMFDILTVSTTKSTTTGLFLCRKMRKNKRKFEKYGEKFDISISWQNVCISWHILVFKEI